MEFAVVNNYMGPVATKVMKGYSEEDIRGGDEFKVNITTSDAFISTLTTSERAAEHFLIFF